jgi:cyanophycin synthetase
VLAAGGAAVFANDGGYIVLAEGDAVPERIVPIADIPITMQGEAPHYAADAMAAAAIAHGLAVPAPVIARGLAGFHGGMHENPGRWTVFEGYPFTLVAERGFNAAAIPWTAGLVAKRSVAGRRILLLTAIGNRADVQYEELAAQAATAFDHFVVYELPDYRRGRAPGEVSALLERALLQHGVTHDRINVAASPEAAVDLASNMVRPGDLVLILTTQAPEQESYIRQAFARHEQAAG